MAECVCRTIVTNRIGTIAVPPKNPGEKWSQFRFALDCPVHGIKSDRSEEPVLSIAEDDMKTKAKAARKRRLARKEAVD